MAPEERRFAEFRSGERGRIAVQHQFAGAVFRILPSDVSGTGTGFFISQDGFALTATHVVSTDSNQFQPASEIRAQSRLWGGSEISLALVDSVSFNDGDVALYRLTSRFEQGQQILVETLPLDVPVFQVAMSQYTQLLDHYAFGFSSLLSGKEVLDVSHVTLGSSNRGSDVHEVKLAGEVDGGFSGGPLTNSRGLTIGVAHEKNIRGVIGTYRLLSTPAIRNLLRNMAKSGRVDSLVENHSGQELIQRIASAASTVAPYFSNFELIALWKVLDNVEARQCLLPSIAQRALVLDEQVADLSIGDLDLLGRAAFQSAASLQASLPVAERWLAGATYQAAENMLIESVSKSADNGDGWTQRASCIANVVSLENLQGFEAHLAQSAQSKESASCGDGSTYQFMASRLLDIAKAQEGMRLTIGRSIERGNGLFLPFLANELASSSTTKGEALTLAARRLDDAGSIEAANTTYQLASLVNPDLRDSYEAWVQQQNQSQEASPLVPRDWQDLGEGVELREDLEKVYLETLNRAGIM